MKLQNHITVFEHETLKTDKGEQKLTHAQFKALEVLHGEKGTPYFSLIPSGVKFCEFVGVLHVGNTLIEILPKADRKSSTELQKEKWRDILIGMLKAVGMFKIYAPSSSHLRLKSNSILDLYFELFIHEVESILHTGLTKRYRKTEGNVSSLKGRLLFAKNIQKNLVHQERFYTDYTTFDYEHKLHFILYKALLLLKVINTNLQLQSRIGALLLNFPEMPDIKVSEETFVKLVYSKKTERYRKAIEIARLLLLNYHPDIAKGTNNVLALMFDMNMLWEKFVYVSIRKGLRSKLADYKISQQPHKPFWQAETGRQSRIEPDIFISKDNDSYILDTKWKILKDSKPSIEDLRQMYVYHDYYEAKKTVLVYPGEEDKNTGGTYIHHITKQKTDKECSIIQLSTKNTIKEWQDSIFKEFNDWAGLILDR